VDLNRWLGKNWWVPLGFVFFVYLVINGIVTGRAFGAHRWYKRSDEPWLFWATMVFYTAAALALVLAPFLGSSR